MTKKQLDKQVENFLDRFIHADVDDDAVQAINTVTNIARDNLDDALELEEKLTPYLKPGMTLHEAVAAYLRAEKQS